MIRKERPKCIVCQNPCKRMGYRYCSNKCQKALETDYRLLNWINNPSSVKEKSGLCPRWIKQLFREIFNNSCQKCSWNVINPVTQIVPLEMNHIDGNGNNNSIENLELLCPNCHSLTPNFKALNKNSIRKDR